MDSSTQFTLLLTMAMILFFAGLLITITGVFILATRATGKDIRTLANQTTKLVQKGLAEEVAGLVGNASALLQAVNQMVLTTAGIGVFLTIFGLILMIVGCIVAYKIQ
jgi:hypothetical protein